MTTNRSAGLAKTIATWFGCGLFPWAPGTVGSLAALLCAWAAHQWLGWGSWHFFAAGALVVIPGIWAAAITAEAVGREDPGIVVVDEVAGQWITLGGVLAFNPRSWLLALVLFRLFDIWKPFPVRRFEDLPGGVGVMADDVMAGLYGALLMYLAGRWNLY